MKLTSFGHSCLLVEAADQRILIDPGAFSTGFEEVRDLDAVLVTHQHPDHADPERLPDLMRANPQAALYTEAQIGEQLRSDLSLDAVDLVRGTPVVFGDVTVEPVGEFHAVIHENVPRIHNTGVVFRAEGEPTLYHPGDALDVELTGLDVLCVPVSAPWSAMKETIDFVARLDPAHIVPIHDAILSDVGRDLYMRQIANLSAGEDRDARTWTETRGVGAVEVSGR